MLFKKIAKIPTQLMGITCFQMYVGEANEGEGDWHIYRMVSTEVGLFSLLKPVLFW